ncbi:ABC transporter substrate-binding protein [Lipingzhangella sp. LS1_29]|uniref:ABC transporter substrate-binding protein n=1 Tax=Lipingzhangella rawalii TaxID=2055835 RepID=A0ABU2H6A4_9ACTN|nr:ABC transporter substrate-binding protein [Lipingzhangella rawalii]MDS1270832.1 ABC transporter substrate-binding protein [Lipingzhangella rawalii]
MRVPLRTLALTTSVVMGATACSGSAITGGEDTDDGTIPIGIIADRTGSTADVGSIYNDGMLAYIDWLNAEGGIEGHEIDAQSEDYAYEVPEAEDLYRRYTADGVVAVQGWGTGDTEALRGNVSADEIPFMSASYSEELTDPEESPYNFVVAPTYSDQMRVALDHIVAEDDAEEVAVFHHDSPFGTAPVGDGADWIDEQDYDLGYESYAMPDDTANFVGMLTQAEDQGASHIVIQNVSSPAAQVAQDLAEQDMDMRIVCLNWCADELFVTTAGEDAAEGHLFVQPFAPPEAQRPGHAEPAAYLEDQGGSLEEEGLHFTQGWYTMHVMAEGMRELVANDEEVTGPTLREALEDLEVDTGGVIGTGTVSFSADSHRGSTSTGIYEVSSGHLDEVAADVEPGQSGE